MALFLSLALNLVVFGIVGGAALNVSRGDERPERIARELGLGPYLYAMDRESRTALETETVKRRSELRDGRRLWRASLAETLEVLRTEPFDAVRFLELVELQAHSADRQRQIGQDLLARQVAGMTQSQRAGFADALERSVRFGSAMREPGGRGEGRIPHAPNGQKAH